MQVEYCRAANHDHLAGVVTLVCVVEGGDGAGVSLVPAVPLLVPALVNVQPRHHEVHHEQPDQVAAAGGR